MVTCLTNRAAGHERQSFMAAASRRLQWNDSWTASLRTTLATLIHLLHARPTCDLSDCLVLFIPMSIHTIHFKDVHTTMQSCSKTKQKVKQNGNT